MKPKPRRIAREPNPDAYSDSTPLTLAEAAALLFPDGPYSESSLRTAARQGLLEVTVLTRKMTTDKAAVRKMLEAARRPAKAQVER